MIVQHHLVLATGIDQFRGSSGQRRMRMPYWIKTDDGPLVFDFITDDTDVHALVQLIDTGLVWVRVEDDN